MPDLKTTINTPSKCSASPERLRGILAVAGATVGMGSGFGLLILSSAFIAPLSAEFGWTRADVSLGYACAAMGMAVGGLLWGRVSDRIDLRWMLAIGGICQVVPLAWLSTVGSLREFLAAHLVLGLFGFGALYAPYVAAAGDWFPARRGQVMGIVTAGGAIGQGALPFLAQAVIAPLGWRHAYLAVAAGMAVVQFFVYMTVRGRQPRQPGAAAQPGSLLTPRLMTLSAAAFFCCACMGMPLFHLAGFVSLICGSASIGAASLLLAMTSGAAGRLAFGYLADRIGSYGAYRIAAAGQAASLVFFPALGDAQSLMILSAIFGFAFSGNMTCLLLCIRQEAPAARLGSAIGFILFVAWAGMAAGGYAGGVLFDVTGNFTTAFRAAATAGLAAFLLLTSLQVLPGLFRRSALGSASV
jgi:predicted MFS family arabinose efflux permease